MEQQELLRRLDIYIEESQDENFDKFLRQMKEIVQNDPGRSQEIWENVERNMGVYRNNMKIYGKKVTPPLQTAGEKKGPSIEFKIGTALSCIGIIFVLIAVFTFVTNFLPDVLQGVLMLVFFTVLWVASELGIRRIAKLMSQIITTAAILFTFCTVVANYHVFETLPRPLALGLLTLIAAVAFFNGMERKSASIQILSFSMYFISILAMMESSSMAEFFVMLAVMAVLNLLWSGLARGKYVDVIRMSQMVAFMVFSLIYALTMAISHYDMDWAVWAVLLYVSVSAVLFGLMYLRGKGSEYAGCWICGSVFYTIFFVVYSSFMYWGGFEVQWLMLSGICAVNLVLCFVGKWERQCLGCYYQSLLLAFCMVMNAGVFPGILVSLALFGVGLWRMKHWKLLNELVFVCYFALCLWRVVPSEAAAAAIFGFLFAATLLCVLVPPLRTLQEKALLYTNVSLMGLVLFGTAFEKNYISYTIVLILAVAAVLIFWRKRFGFAEYLQGMVLAMVITYMIFIYRIQMPVLVSILLMVLAIVAIGAGFFRKERSMRIYGLCLSLFVCAKVVIYDYWDLELMPKSLLFLVIGIIAILISVIYILLEARGQKIKKMQAAGSGYGQMGMMGPAGYEQRGMAEPPGNGQREMMGPSGYGQREMTGPSGYEQREQGNSTQSPEKTMSETEHKENLY